MVVPMTDVLSIVEAAYRIEEADEAWISGIARACRSELDQGLGFALFEFSFSSASPLEILRCHHAFMPEPLAETYPRMLAKMGERNRQLPFLRGPCITGSEMTGSGEEFRRNPQMQAYAQTFGMFDSIWITALDPTGHGLGLHVGLPEIRTLAAVFRERWARLGAHFASALRLKRRLDGAGSGAEAAEAVFRPDGQACEVAKELKGEPTELQVVRKAVVELERLRGTGPRSDRALRAWSPVVAGRWTLLDEFSRGEDRYVVARYNEPSARGPATLTKRERQVLSLAAVGQDNKTIAYALGLAHSTVRVLMARAAQKLEAKDREEAIVQFRRDSKPPE